jgi:hypothetical protein
MVDKINDLLRIEYSTWLCYDSASTADIMEHQEKTFSDTIWTTGATVQFIGLINDTSSTSHAI